MEPKEKKESLHGGHRERLKNRFEQEGLDSFEEHNALELLLFYAIPRIDTNEIAHRLIEEFGSFPAVLEASKEDLMRVKGIGASAAVLIKMIPEYARYYLNKRNAKGTVIASTAEAGDFFKNKFIGMTKECVYLACLDSKGKVLSYGKISEGSVNATSIGIRQIVEQAMKVGAVSVLIAHNHPKGFAIPSHRDVVSTIKIRKALLSVELNLLDHFVVAENDYVSMAESGIFREEE